MHRSVPRQFSSEKGPHKVVQHNDDGTHVVLFTDKNKKVCIHWLQKLEREEAIKRKKNHIKVKPSGWRKIVVDGAEYWWKGSHWPTIKRVSDSKVWEFLRDYYLIVHPNAWLDDDYTWTPKDIADCIKFVEAKGAKCIQMH